MTENSLAANRRGLSRRRLLLGAGGVLGVIAGGGLYVTRSLQGDFGDYSASSSFPVVTTRGRLGGSDAATDAAAPDGDAVRTTGSWAFEDADELFVFVHGFGTDADAARDQAYATQVGLESTRPAPVVAYSWDSDVEWGPAKRNADANGPLLAAWLTDRADSDGRPVHLLGYSLGARVTCEALVALADANRTDALASASLLGGAVPNDSVERDGPYGAAIAALDLPVTNFHNRADKVLGWLYRLSDRTQAVGESGIADPDAAPSGYRDVDVTNLVEDHYSYFEPGEGCLPQVVESLP